MSELDDLMDLKVRTVDGWPVPGVVFRDINPLLADARGLALVIGALEQDVTAAGWGRIDLVAGIEARGFIVGAPLAVALGVGFVPVRKQGKLPGDVHTVTYDLEYGTASLELQTDAVAPRMRVLLVDDVLATGGTAAAAVGLVRSVGAEVAGVVTLIELLALGGRAALPDVAVRALRAY